MKRSVRFSLKICACLTVVSLSSSLVYPLTTRATPQTHRGEETGEEKPKEDKPSFWKKYKWYLLGGGAVLTLTVGGVIIYLLKRERRRSQVEPDGEIELNLELSENDNLVRVALLDVLIAERNNPEFICADKQHGTVGLETGEGTLFDEYEQQERVSSVHDFDGYLLSGEKAKIQHLIDELCTNPNTQVRFKKFLARLLANHRPGSPTLDTPAAQAIDHEFGQNGMILLKKLLKPFGIAENFVGEALEKTVAAEFFSMSNDARIEVARHTVEQIILCRYGLIHENRNGKLSHKDSLQELRQAQSSHESSGELSRTDSMQQLSEATEQDEKDIEALQQVLDCYQSGIYKDSDMRSFHEAAVVAKDLKAFVLNSKGSPSIKTVEHVIKMNPKNLEKTATIFNEYVLKPLGFRKTEPNAREDTRHTETQQRAWEVVKLFGDDYRPLLTHYPQLS